MPIVIDAPYTPYDGVVPGSIGSARVDPGDPDGVEWRARLSPGGIPRTERSMPSPSAPGRDVAAADRGAQPCELRRAERRHPRRAVAQHRQPFRRVRNDEELELVDARAEAALGPPPLGVAGEQQAVGAALAKLERARCRSRGSGPGRAAPRRPARSRAGRRSRAAARPAAVEVRVGGREDEADQIGARGVDEQLGRAAAARPGVASQRSTLARTAEALKRAPSWKRTPGRSRSRQTVESRDGRAESASPGTSRASSNGPSSRSISGSCDLPGGEQVGLALRA